MHTKYLQMMLSTFSIFSHIEDITCHGPHCYPRCAYRIGRMAQLSPRHLAFISDLFKQCLSAINDGPLHGA